MPSRSALLSVSDKTGLADFARILASHDIRLISTGGTAEHLRRAGLEVVDVSAITGFPEILDGRVKTLHPAIHGGLLARRDDATHMHTIGKHGIAPIDFVVVNLYPFAAAAAKPGNPVEAVIEQIDIGGPSMLRSAAKNHSAVTVITDPADYARVADDLAAHGETTPATRAALAAKVFLHTSAYDAAIANYLHAHLEESANGEAEAKWPTVLTLSMPLQQPMRYGENPHQAAAFYRDPDCGETSVAGSRQLHGKELSYNNILDAEGALEMVRDFADLSECAAVIVKHSNPCGIGIGATPLEAYERARSTDPTSAFGGIVALSREVDAPAATAIGETFMEIVLAPSFSGEALAILTKKKNLRLLATGPFTPKVNSRIVRGVVGGAVVTERDLGTIGDAELRVVTKSEPTAEDRKALLFAWRCVKWVKSNAIVYTSETRTLGIGAGQMSRVDSAKLGAWKAAETIGGERPLAGSYMASDAFFPFRDCVDIAAGLGVRAIVQPGGSQRDQESIDAADAHGIPMVFTAMRHFRH